MNLTKFRVQTGGVLALLILVGWPRFQPASTITVWRSSSPIAPQPQLVDNDARVQAGQDGTKRRRRTTARRDSDDAASNETARRAALEQQRAMDAADPRDLASAGAKVNAIVGRARTLTNQPVPYGRMVLRNTITGLIEARAIADQEGRFSFVDVIPSGYIVELVGADGTVIASSEVVAVGNGDMRQATVRVAANSTVRAVFGSNVLAPTVQEAVNRAVQNGTRTVSEPTSAISPQ